MSVSNKIKGTYLANGIIRIGDLKIHYDLFLNDNGKSGLLLNEKFFDLSKGNIVFLRLSKKGNLKTIQFEH